MHAALQRTNRRKTSIPFHVSAFPIDLRSASVQRPRANSVATSAAERTPSLPNTRALAVDAARQAADSKDEETAARLASLSEREREVMQRVAAGKLNKVIADELCISVRTVEVHRARVFGKLGVRSAAEVATLLARGR